MREAPFRMLQAGEPACDRLAQNLRDLAIQLDDIAAGHRPNAEDLAGAPLLDAWEPRLTAARAPAFRGRVSGHALLADGSMLRCEILAADPDLRWIMTWAGFYRLGAEIPSASDHGAEA